MASGVKADLRSIKKAMKKMERAGVDTRPVWRGLRTPLRKDQVANMKAGEDSKGGKWKPLSSSTIAYRKSLSGRTTKSRKRGRLPATKEKVKTKRAAKSGLSKLLGRQLVSGAKVKIKRDRISITSKVPWAGVHQHGGRAGRGARIPKREFMYASDTLIKHAATELAEHVADAFNKGG